MFKRDVTNSENKYIAIQMSESINAYNSAGNIIPLYFGTPTYE